jgi:hypothetical protein
MRRKRRHGDGRKFLVIKSTSKQKTDNTPRIRRERKGWPSRPTGNRAPLRSVLRYRNPDVVDRYLRDFGGRQSEAGVIFSEMLKWLYLIDRAGSTPCIMTADFGRIDHMWHTFILFTQDYVNFCRDHFGRYIHHQPVTNRGPVVSISTQRRQWRACQQLVKAELGQKTFNDWFVSRRFADTP